MFVEGDTGKLITKDGRGHIIKDPEAKDFPWYPKTVEQMIQGTLMKGEEEVDSTTLGDTVKAIYFSASWVSWEKVGPGSSSGMERDLYTTC